MLTMMKCQLYKTYPYSAPTDPMVGFFMPTT
nr:MAG TPA: hypothetical protein [Caudoviricetes sp.]